MSFYWESWSDILDAWVKFAPIAALLVGLVLGYEKRRREESQ